MWIRYVAHHAKQLHDLISSANADVQLMGHLLTPVIMTTKKAYSSCFIKSYVSPVPKHRDIKEQGGWNDEVLSILDIGLVGSWTP
jgi:hypothetical protein